jgi:hypothetical protein
MYIPRDERFEESKKNTFAVKRLKGVLHNLLPGLKSSLSAHNQDFNEFSDVDGLYSVGLLIKLGLQDDVLKKLPLPKIVSKIQESSQGILKYDIPKIISSEYALLIVNFLSFLLIVFHMSYQRPVSTHPKFRKMKRFHRFMVGSGQLYLSTPSFGYTIEDVVTY